jgi:hypothetical protein
LDGYDRPRCDPGGLPVGARMNRFQFIYEYDGARTTVEIDGDSNLSDTLDAIERFLIAAGFDKAQARQGVQDVGDAVTVPTPGPAL